MDTRHCPNCGYVLSPQATLCPNCGAPAEVSPVWPPPPENFVPPPLPPPPRLITGRAWGDITLGVVTVFGSLFIFGLGLFVMPILYFVLRPTYPVYARGIGYGLLTVLVLLLGAIATCFYSISTSRGSL